MYGTREFRFSYTDENGQEAFIWARNEWQAQKAAAARKADPRTVKRAPVTKRRQSTNTHCQICGRDILSQSGLIAHHGYTRPHGQGWQSASCFGARWRPYEVACDALPPAIKLATDYLANQEEHRRLWVAEPPVTITYWTRETYNKPSVKVVLDRPEGFDPAKVGETGYWRADDYTHRWASELSQTDMNIRHAKQDIAALKKRLADWISPASAEAAKKEDVA